MKVRFRYEDLKIYGMRVEGMYTLCSGKNLPMPKPYRDSHGILRGPFLHGSFNISIFAYDKIFRKLKNVKKLPLTTEHGLDVKTSKGYILGYGGPQPFVVFEVRLGKIIDVEIENPILDAWIVEDRFVHYFTTNGKLTEKAKQLCKQMEVEKPWQKVKLEGNKLHWSDIIDSKIRL